MTYEQELRKYSEILADEIVAKEGWPIGRWTREKRVAFVACTIRSLCRINDKKLKKYDRGNNS